MSSSVEKILNMELLERTSGLSREQLEAADTESFFAIFDKVDCPNRPEDVSFRRKHASGEFRQPYP